MCAPQMGDLEITSENLAEIFFFRFINAVGTVRNISAYVRTPHTTTRISYAIYTSGRAHRMHDNTFF